MRRALAAVLVAALCIFATLPVGAQQVAFVPVPVKPHTEPPVAIEAIAQKLGWTFKRTADGAIVDDGNGPSTLRIGSRLVREDGVDVALFAEPARDLNGHIALAISDAATLFHLIVQHDGTHLALVTQIETDVAYREVPRPATPPPVAAPAAAKADYTPPPLVNGNAGTLSVSVQFDGNNRTYQTNLSGNAGVVHGALSSYGNEALTNPAGAVTIGAASRNLALGSINNPFSGSVLTNGSITGAAAHLAAGGSMYDVTAGNGVTGNAYALTMANGNTTDSIGYVSGEGARNQLLLRHAVAVPQTWGTLERETLIGMQGTAEGLHARTNGKTFFDGTMSFVNGALPLNPGDAPTGAVIGEHLSPVTTISAGYVRSMQAPGSPTFGISTRWNNLNFAANISQHWTNLTASYASGSAYGTLFASTGIQQLFGLNAGISAGKALAEVNVNSSGGSTTGIAQLRTNHAGLNFAGGLDLNAGTIRPLIGVVAPLAPSLAVEVGLVPAPSGKPGLRISLLAGFRQAKPHVTTFPVTVMVADAAQYGALRLFVDGVRSPQPFTGDAPVRLAAGRHTISVESTDQKFAATTSDVFTGAGAASTANVRLALVQQRSIAGSVAFGGSKDGDAADASLEGIRVVLEPSGESATTDANGRFVFARGPYIADTTILLDPSTVPGRFESPGKLAIGDGPVVVALEPARKVEHTTFH